MLKLGEKIIKDIYLGDKKIAKAFLGDKLVFQAGKPIFLDYIESSGSYLSGQYIDTGIIFTENHKIDITWQAAMVNTTTSYYSVCGTRTASASGLWISYGDTSKLYTCWGSVFSFNDENYLGKHNAVLSKEGTYVDGVLKQDNSSKTFPILDKTMLLFARWLSVDKNYSNGCRIYDCKIYENNELIQHLKPCIHPNGTVCFYDMVTQKYFYNQGTGTLKAGGRFVESIVFDGDSCINTGINSLSTWKIGAVGEQTGYLRFLIANGGTAAQFFGYHSSGYWCLGAPTEFHFNTPFTQYIDCTITFSKGLITATVGEQTLTRTGNILTADYFLGGWTGNNAYYFKGKVYYCRNYNSEGTLIQDLRPYVDENGVACFKDVVTNTLFYNQGTGTLTYTE